MKYRICAVWVICIITYFAFAESNLSVGSEITERKEEVKPLIVMLKGQIGGGETAGAGIIFGQDPSRLFIITANHVVRWGGKDAENLKVEFSWLPGKIDASLWEKSGCMSDIDLAVITVDLKNIKYGVDKIPFDRLGDPEALPGGEPDVYPIGNPGGKLWFVPQTPNAFQKLMFNKIEFESPTLGQGFSGGGLFNNQWELVGMITAEEPPISTAVSVELIIECLKRNRIPVSMKPFNPEEKVLRVPWQEPNEPKFNPKKDITLEAWFKTNALGKRQSIITKHHPNYLKKEPYYQYHLELRQPGTLYFALGINGKRRFIDGAFPGKVLPGKWYHVAASYNGNIMKLYLNGDEWHQKPRHAGFLKDYGRPLLIGGSDKWNPFYGKLADIRIWEVARTDDQIKFYMNKTIPSSEKKKGLVLSLGTKSQN